MLVIKGVKVHEDTHRALKLIKAQRRCGSIDEVIRELVRSSTGKTVEEHIPKKNASLSELNG